MRTVAQEIKQELLQRFLRYVRIDTQSDPTSSTFPSTQKQLNLINLLHEELLSLGVVDVEVDKYGYLMAKIPASPGYEQATPIGLLAHVDTSPDMLGANVCPQIVCNYDGTDIPLGNSGYTLTREQFPELLEHLGHDLITTDGTTLLGADNKAGVAEIVTLVSYLYKHPELNHGPICIGFTLDEEIGTGVDYFDVARFGAKYAYTVDGGIEGELEYENFNAASATLSIRGRSVHPGYARGKMINALEVALHLHSLLPAEEKPECTSGYEGFYHLVQLSGSVEDAQMQYIIRDHDASLFAEKLNRLSQVVSIVKERYPGVVVELILKEQYRNMKEQVEQHPELIQYAQEAMLRTGIKPRIKPIRGGTDGARLSFMGLPCPNLFTGGLNFHGRYEYASLTTMSRCVAMLVELVYIWGEKTKMRL